ncbi:MAG: tetratricopeptide repeat protein [Candidatus Glassbacteria bacterium]
MAAKKNISIAKKSLLITLVAIVSLIIIWTVTRKKPDRNLVLITVDTIRADRLHCYGYDEISTPNMDFLAANGVLFENAISPAPLTLPSHTTLLTGLYPQTHGVRDNTTYKLSDKAVTLAEILHDNGYNTAAVVGAFVLHSSYGLDQGFEYYNDELPNPPMTFTSPFSSQKAPRIRMKEISERPASIVTKRALSWLRQSSDERFFLWIHYYDPHFPYNPPPPYSSKYLERPYDGEIAFVDNNIGAILTQLRNDGLLDRTLVVLAGDHGEGLGEHEEETHSIFLYEPTIRVPLIMSYPDRIPSGTRVNSVVSLVDVVPTILELLAVPAPTDLNGMSLLDLLEKSDAGSRFVYSESMYPYLNYGWSKLKSIRGQQWKYIKAPSPELYNVTEDPFELNNLIHSETDVAARLEASLDSILSETSSKDTSLAEDVSLSAMDRERLLALGYIAGAPPVRDKESLKDPKDMIKYHDLINKGEKAMETGSFDEALEDFKRVISADSDNALVHNLAGMIYYQLNDTSKARIEFENAIELNPNLTDAHHNLGNIYFHQENYTEAASCYEKSVELEPAAGDYWAALGQIYARMGEMRKAEKSYRRALELGFSSPQLLLANGITLMRLGRFADSRESFEEALRADPGYIEIYNEYGNLMDRMGNYTEAISKYKQALSIDPESIPARYNLARILIKTGRENEAIKELHDVVKKDPDHSEAHYLLGELYYKKGNRRLAAENFKRFLELHTENEAARRQAEARLKELR